MADPIQRDPDRARAAHLLRRATLVPLADRVDRLADRGWNDAVDVLLDDVAEQAALAATEAPTATEHWDEVVGWWLERMLRPDTGLNERLAWFWHTLLTTNAEKVGSAPLVADQLVALRTHAAGDYRSLLQAYTASGATLRFLDADWSMAANPNENLARELMELFTLGPGQYSEDDVRAAARALAGWVVEDDQVSWRRENAFVAPLLFRGVQDTWDLTSIVDHLCDQPETAIHVSSALWHHLWGDELSPEEADDLGRWWFDRDLDILSLVERILRADGFADRRLNRPRSGLEWYLAYHAATGVEMDNLWRMVDLGQMPYLPPNVGGWPQGDRWLGTGSALARLGVATDLQLDVITAGRSGTVDDILDRCALHEVSATTLAVLDDVRASDALSPESAHQVRWWLALSSPEFHLS